MTASQCLYKFLSNIDLAAFGSALNAKSAGLVAPVNAWMRRAPAHDRRAAILDNRSGHAIR